LPWTSCFNYLIFHQQDRPTCTDKLWERAKCIELRWVCLGYKYLTVMGRNLLCKGPKCQEGWQVGRIISTVPALVIMRGFCNYS
jgi:hypothetical protein